MRRLRSWSSAGLPAWVPWLVVAAGLLLRLERYLNNRSFWLDESLLGLNLIEKSYRELLGALAYVQSAPSGFLLIEKTSADLFGESERALRLFPFLSSIASVVLLALVVRRLLPPWPGLLVLTLFAVNEPLLYQSSEAKPYSSDAAIALLIVWLTCRALDEQPISLRGAAPLAITGVLVVWISYPSIFVLAGALAALLVRAEPSARRRIVAVLAPIAALFAASFLALYAVTSRNITTVSASVFAGDPHSSSRLKGLARAGWVALVDPGGFLTSMRGLAFLCFVVGVVAVAARERLDLLTLLVGPGLLAVVAAALSRYPFGGRFSLFLVSFLLILIAVGVRQLVTSSRRPWLVGVPLVFLLVAPPVEKTLRRVPDPPKREHVRPLLARLSREWRPGDTLYIHRNAQYAVRFYAECDCGLSRFPFPVRPAPPGIDNSGLPAALASSGRTVIGRDVPLAQELERFQALRGRARVWLLFTHAPDEAYFTTYLDTIGHKVTVYAEPGATLYLYDLRGGGP